MEKPINRFAISLWVAAFLVLAAEIPVALHIQHIAGEIRLSQGAAMGNLYGIATLWAAIRTAVLGAGQLAGIGVLIELVDRIRWDRARAARPVTD